MASSSAPWARPTAWAATPGRARSSVIIALLESVALLAAEEVLGRDPAVLEVELVHRDATDAHLVLVLADLEARQCPFSTMMARDAAVPAIGSGRAVDGVEAGGVAVGIPLLVAVDDVVVAVAFGAGAQAAGIRAGRLLRRVRTRSASRRWRQAGATSASALRCRRR